MAYSFLQHVLFDSLLYTRHPIAHFEQNMIPMCKKLGVHWKHR